MVSKFPALSMFGTLVSHDKKVTKGDKMGKDYSVGS